MTADAEIDFTERERSLATAARSGDRHAFEGLVRLQEAALYRFIRRYVGDADEAYDLLQEAFISAWLAMRRFDVRQSFGAWLRVIALNKCRDFGRRRAARRRWHALFAVEPTQPGHSAIGSDHESPGPPESARTQRLDRAIADLPRFYKEPLLLTTVGGLTQSQAALLLKTTPKAIEMRIRRARKRLGEALPDEALSDGTTPGIAEG